MLNGIVDLAEDIFGLPARVGVPPEMPGVSERIRNPRNATVIGLLYAARGDVEAGGESSSVSYREEEGEGLLAKIKEWLRNNF